MRVCAGLRVCASVCVRARACVRACVRAYMRAKTCSVLNMHSATLINMTFTENVGPTRDFLNAASICRRTEFLIRRKRIFVHRVGILSNC